MSRVQVNCEVRYRGGIYVDLNKTNQHVEVRCLKAILNFLDVNLFWKLRWRVGEKIQMVGRRLYVLDQAVINRFDVCNSDRIKIAGENDS